MTRWVVGSILHGVNPLNYQETFYLHHLTDRITHTVTFVTPVVEHWLECVECIIKSIVFNTFCSCVNFIIDKSKYRHIFENEYKRTLVACGEKEM